MVLHVAAKVPFPVMYGLCIKRFSTKSTLVSKIVAKKVTFHTAHNRAIRQPTMSISESVVRTLNSVEKPVVDTRDYRVIQLSNQLEAVLISDKDTDKASAALAVNVGSYSDPSNLYGLAHFCEHLLFMGTEKYPVENEYSQYLHEHSGHSNAYTSSEHTNYFFSVSHDALHGALDRFAQFFVAPLFSEDCKDREIRAVDSENKKNLQQDLWRLHQLIRSLSNPKHPYNKFSTGNLVTLDEEPRKMGLDVRDELLKFYKSHYSSNLMKLCIIGREDLDTLTQWTVDLFSSIPNSNIKPEWGPEKIASMGAGFVPFTSNELGRFIQAKPVQKVKKIELMFPVPDQQEFYRSKPAYYYSHLIGHEGPGSLLHYFKQKQWATELSAGNDNVIAGTSHFVVEIHLTNQGAQCYEDVIEAFFQYTAMLNASGAQKWIFEELRDVAEAEFKFRQKVDPMRASSNMTSIMLRRNIPREHLLSMSLVRDFDANAIEDFGKHLVPSNFQVLYTASDLKDLEQREKWYGTEYSVKKFSSAFLERLNRAATSQGQNVPELHLPAPNEFIATNFDVIKKDVSKPLQHPHLLKHTDQMAVWHKKDDMFWVPKASMRLRLINPLCSSSPAFRVRTKLLVNLMSESLMEFGYAAEIAGLRYDLDTTRSGILLTVYGYNHKLPVLVDRILRRLESFSLVGDGPQQVENRLHFTPVKEALERDYFNMTYANPYEQIGVNTLYLTNEDGIDISELVAELKTVSESDIEAFKHEMFSSLDFELLVDGNMVKEEVLKVADNVKAIFSWSHALSASQKIPTRSYILPQGKSYYYEHYLADHKNVNSCIEYLCQVSLRSDRRARVALETLCQIAHEPAFNQLRTKEQLGYVVFSGMRNTRTTSLFRVLVQSERSTDYLESRIDNFLNLLGETLRNISEDDFQGHVKSLINHKKTKLVNLNKEADRFWDRITSGYFDFTSIDKDVEMLEEISKQEVVHLFDEYVSPSSSKRAKLVVHLKAHKSALETKPELLMSGAVVSLAEKKGISLNAAQIEGMSNQCQGLSVEEAMPLLSTELKKYMSEQEAQDFMQELQVEFAKMTNEANALSSAYPEGEKIVDVGVFKAHQKLTEAPTPVQDLSSFFDNDYKL